MRDLVTSNKYSQVPASTERIQEYIEAESLLDVFTENPTIPTMKAGQESVPDKMARYPSS